MNKVRLEDVSERGSSNLAQKDVENATGAYPIYGAAGYIGNIDFYHQEKEYIAVVKDGAGVGRTMFLPGKSSVIGTLQYIVPKENILPKYLYYAVKNMKLARYYTGATIPHIYYKDYKKEAFWLPDIHEQQRVVRILEKIEKIIEERQQTLVDLDMLVKSRFVEMFGDPSINPKGWKEINISEIIDGKVSNGFFAKRDDYASDGNVSVLGVANVVNRMYSQCENLPKTYGTEKDIKKFQLRYGDLLFCRSSLVAEGIGKASIVPKDIPKGVLFECHVIRLPLNLEQCVPEYIQMLTNTEYYRNQILSHSKTATMTTIGQDGILKTRILLPPLKLQHQFLDFVEQADKLKFS